MSEMVQKSWQSDMSGLLRQFKGLGGHPAFWPFAPRIVCGVAMVLAVILAGWWLFWTTQWETLETGRLEEQRKKEAFQLKVGQAQSLEFLRRQKIQVQAQVEKLEQQLPSKAEMDALLSDINQAGIGRGLQFELFKPAQIQLRDYYAELPIDIKLTGSYHALAAFTSDIAHLPRIVTLDKLVISSARDGIQSFEAVARTFRYLDKEEVAQRKKQLADAKTKGRK
jgi:type IV pilus assembly protein PilO